MLVDKFDGSGDMDPAVRQYHAEIGVEVINRDVIADGLGGIPGDFDVVTTFDSLEHWHHSPKRLLHEVTQKLRPGGILIIGVPNCANVKKRALAILGRTQWSSMAHWYEERVFTGHVREPSVSDLYYIARDTGLRVEAIYGRNWLGYRHPKRYVRWATALADYPLQLRPSLCADLYLVGRKTH